MEPSSKELHHQLDKLSSQDITTSRQVPLARNEPSLSSDSTITSEYNIGRRDSSGVNSSLSSRSGRGSAWQNSGSSFSSRNRRVCSVFVSHTGQDRGACTFASLIARFLEKDGIDAFMDTRSIDATTAWPADIEANVRNCHVFICVLSENYFKRYWTHRELDLALQTDRVILPVHYSDVDFTVDPYVRSQLYRELERHDDENASVVSRRWSKNIRTLHDKQGVRNKFAQKDNDVPFLDQVVAKTKNILDISFMDCGANNGIAEGAEGAESTDNVGSDFDVNRWIDHIPNDDTERSNENVKEIPNHTSFAKEEEEEDGEDSSMKSRMRTLLGGNQLSESEKYCKSAIAKIAAKEALQVGNKSYIRSFEEVDYDIIQSTPVASGLPNEPWAIYARRASSDYVRVEYNAILRRTVARLVPASDVSAQESESVAAVHWEIPPTLWVEDVPRLVYDDRINRSRVLTRKNWMYVTSAVFEFFHFGASFVGLILSRQLKGRGGWLVMCDVVVGVSLRFGCTWIARLWNNGSVLQASIAMLSPMFWCLSYAGAEGPRVARWWRLPMWTKLIMSIVCFALNTYRARFDNEFGSLGVLLSACGLPFLLLLYHSKIPQEWFGSPGAFSPDAGFIIGVGMAHAYVILSNILLFAEAHEDDKWIFLFVIPVFLETAVILRTGEKLRDVLKKSSLARRYNHAGENFSLLAGTTMAVSLTSGLDEHDDNDNTRLIVPLTWVVRGEKLFGRLGASGRWDSANILLPGPWKHCRLESRAVVRDIGDGVTIHVLNLRRAIDTEGHTSCGNSTIATGPALTEYFRLQGGEDCLPSTYMEKDGVGFIRAIGGGIVGLPIV